MGEMITFPLFSNYQSQRTKTVRQSNTFSLTNPTGYVTLLTSPQNMESKCQHMEWKCRKSVTFMSARPKVDYTSSFLTSLTTSVVSPFITITEANSSEWMMAKSPVGLDLSMSSTRDTNPSKRRANDTSRRLSKTQAYRWIRTCHEHYHRHKEESPSQDSVAYQPL